MGKIYFSFNAVLFFFLLCNVKVTRVHTKYTGNTEVYIVKSGGKPRDYC